MNYGYRMNVLFAIVLLDLPSRLYGKYNISIIED